MKKTYMSDEMYFRLQYLWLKRNEAEYWIDKQTKHKHKKIVIHINWDSLIHPRPEKNCETAVHLSDKTAV